MDGESPTRRPLRENSLAEAGRDRFDVVLEALESEGEWVTNG
jgi:hypothetical protein